MAIAVTLVFMGAVTATFLQISKGHSYAEARMDALRNGRSALTMMGEVLKTLDVVDQNNQYAFQGAHLALSVGDAIDNDGDGAKDEEEVNGVCDTPSPTPPIEARHATLGLHSERPKWAGEADLGDSQVDVDARFGRDQLQITMTPNNQNTGIDKKRITYVVTQFEGEDNVLVRQVETWPTGQADPTISMAPLAFKVAGLDLLYWDSNGDPDATPPTNIWLTEWDSSAHSNPELQLPAAVYIRLSMIADPRPPAALTLGQPMDVVPLETIVNIESVIGNGLYKRPNL